MTKPTYQEFLRAKLQLSQETGFVIEASDINPLLKPHQRDIVQWAVRGGRRGIFAAFGLGKSPMQNETARQIRSHAGGRFLQVAPLGVRGDLIRDGHLDTKEYRQRADELGLDHSQVVKDYGIDLQFVQKTHQVGGDGFYLTNYESVRDGKIDMGLFSGVSLDEASILRGFGGTKTFREMMRLFEGTATYRFVATATPSPNEFIELLAYAAFLDIMDVGQAKTRFFKRNSEKADQLTLHPHKEREFWLWVSSWAVFLERPSDLGYSDEGYELPEMEVHWHELPSEHTGAGYDSSGQGRLIRNSSLDVTSAAREKRESLPARIEKLKELRAIDPSAHRLIWHDLEAERVAIEEALTESANEDWPWCKGFVQGPKMELGYCGPCGGHESDPIHDKAPWASVYGSQDLDEREAIIAGFSSGRVGELAAKPVMCGSGCNFQRYCSWEIFLGIGFKFNDFYQAIHRVNRFLQKNRVRVDLIYTEAERGIRQSLERKWAQHKELASQMSAIIRKYGLASNAIHGELERSMGCERFEASGEKFKAVNNDTVVETAQMESDSTGLILTSIPFSTQYEYTPSYNDFGHTDSNEHFWQQMDYLIPELFRVLQPGRVAAIHVKDRITPGGLSGYGFQTVYPFHLDTYTNFVKHGFAYLGMKTIVTDVVRENAQTYRLGWTEQCKDGSRMGVGMPEYLMLFRKPPTDSSNGYADLPVVKNKKRYSRSRWQIDAHGFERSSGNRLLSVEDLMGVKHDTIFKLFRNYSETQVYDYEHHIALCESLERCRTCGHIHTGQKECGESHHEISLCPECNGEGPTLAAEGFREPCPTCDGGYITREIRCECLKSGGILPVTFMLLQPTGGSEDVWTDIARMRTLNGAQSAAGRENHLCPMQFDIADRVINQFSMAGELVFDPFMGIGTVPMCAVKMGRRGAGNELSPDYFRDAVGYLQAAEKNVDLPTLFDLIPEEVA